MAFVRNVLSGHCSTSMVVLLETLLILCVFYSLWYVIYFLLFIVCNSIWKGKYISITQESSCLFHQTLFLHKKGVGYVHIIALCHESPGKLIVNMTAQGNESVRN